MGALLSALGFTWKEEVVEDVILVPPLFERHILEVTRFMNSPLNKMLTGRLFEDYFHKGFAGKIVLTTKEEPKLTLLSNFEAGEYENIDGSLCIRTQPSACPYNFGEVSISSKASALVRACWMVPNTGLFLSYSHPLSQIRGSKASPHFGICYASKYLNSGAKVPTLSDLPATCWMAIGNGNGNLKGVVECRAMLSKKLDQSVLSSLRYGVVYTSGLKSNHITASAHILDNEKLHIEVLQRMLVKRRVKNPFEKDNVVGISNVVDAGFSVVTPLGAHENEVPDMKMGLQWQMNKNICVKGFSSLKALGTCVAFKSWWDPTFTVSINGSYEYETGKQGFGIGLKMENTGDIVYARADDKSGPVAPTRESQASMQESDMQSDSRPKYKESHVSMTTEKALAIDSEYL